MNPRLVVICSFVVGCMIVASGAIFGRKAHPPESRDLPVATASDSVSAKPTQPDPTPQESAQPDTTPPGPSQQTSKKPAAVPPDPPVKSSMQQGATPPDTDKQVSAEHDSTKQEPTKQDPTKQDPTKQDSTKQDTTKQDPMQPASAPPDSAPSLPVMLTYELKKARETTSVIARDPKGFWIRQIVAKIEAKKADLPKSLDGPVAVQLEFAVGRDGALISKSISKSSGSEEADKTALAMLERAQPFPPMPDGLQEKEMTFSLPVRFR